MSRVCTMLMLATLFIATSPSAVSQVEVLYLAQPEGTNFSLTTYNVNADTAVAEPAAEPMTVRASNVDPITVSGHPLIYVWNSTDVWMFLTNAKGVPHRLGSQHLKFNLPHPVATFVADPDGKFAYAAMSWIGDPYNSIYTDLVLFTIDQSTGQLTDTGEIVGTYGPNPYIGMRNFSFGSSGRRLYGYYHDNGPHTCIIGYDYYAVNQTTGHLGPVTQLFYGQADCSGAGAVTFTDKFTAMAQACCSSGSGFVNVNPTFAGKAISCEYTPAFCADSVGNLALDPASKNLFFGDANTGQTYIGHLDFVKQQLIESASTISGTPQIYFSPDSLLVYAVNSNDIGVYAFQSKTGTLGANTSLPDGGNVSIATATLP
ncbi:MAG TPA: hypothetical protein VIW68_05075 [Candidatus Sulfotelmatobacter sp.]